MLATWVHARLSPMSFDEAAEAMKGALRNEIGSDPTRECLALALAKCALETGRFRAIWNWNFGNIKAGSTYVGQYCCFELNEVLGGKVVWFGPRGRLSGRGGVVVAEACSDPPGHPQTRMRANVNRYDGAIRYVDFMVRGAGGRFANAYGFMLAGNAIGMCHEMKLRGYYTAPEADYSRGVVSLQKEFVGKLAGQRPPEVHHTEAEYEAFRTFRNEELLTSFTRAEFERLLDGPSLGGGRAMLEHERASDTDPSDLAPESEPYANG
jgi:hypothetical protein